MQFWQVLAVFDGTKEPGGAHAQLGNPPASQLPNYASPRSGSNDDMTIAHAL